MNSTPTPPFDIDSYDSEILLGLGLITTEFSRLEDEAKKMLAIFISPHQFVGRMIVANTNIQMSIENLKAIADERLEPGALRSAIEDWIKEVERLKALRNQYVHSRWIVHAGTAKDQVKKGKFKTVMRHIRPIELFELAEQMWESHQEGHHLIFDLATAGFSSVNCISSLGESKKDPDTSYRLKGTTLGGRPAIKGCWPGRKYYPVKQ